MAFLRRVTCNHIMIISFNICITWLELYTTSSNLDRSGQDWYKNVCRIIAKSQEFVTLSHWIQLSYLCLPISMQTSCIMRKADLDHHKSSSHIWNRVSRSWLFIYLLFIHDMWKFLLHLLKICRFRLYMLRSVAMFSLAWFCQTTMI